MSRTIVVHDIAQWEDTDSELAKYTIGKLQEENKRLKEQCKEWKENHKAVCIQRDNILDNIVKDTEDRIDYKSRIDKAIDYILPKMLNEYLHSDYVIKMIDILRGKNKPQYLGYSDKECINCGRLRVEKYSDGTEICEKCNFDQNKKEYVLRGEDYE